MTDHKTQRLQHVAELLNAVGRDTETKILSTLEEANPNLASQIREKMFTFDDLTLIDNRQMQVLLKELDPELLVLSCLLYTSPSPRDKRQSRMPSSA